MVLTGDGGVDLLAVFANDLCGMFVQPLGLAMFNLVLNLVFEVGECCLD